MVHAYNLCYLGKFRQKGYKREPSLGFSARLCLTTEIIKNASDVAQWQSACLAHKALTQFPVLEKQIEGK